MLIKDIKGLKYPDEHVIKFFFKENLQSSPGKVLELGCGNANNLSMFYQYGWDVVGVDILREAINNAEYNIEVLKSQLGVNSKFSFVADNMINFLQTSHLNGFDALLLPGSLYYQNPEDINVVLELLSSKKILKKGGIFFFKMRLTNDYRYGKGRQIGHNSFVLDIKETGEYGAINTFYTGEGFVKIVNKLFDTSEMKVAPVSYVNYQNGVNVYNSELIVWGRSNV